MGIPNNTHQVASNAIAALGNWISLHTGAGAGTTGANEAAGGSYARQQPAGGWSPGTTGVNTAAPVPIPCAAGTYTEGGIWSAQSGGTFVGSNPFAGGNVIVSGTNASIVVTPTVNA
ncbi:hypothetical protein PP405_11635 [Mycobacteroides abscessus]|uniref:phage tail fiber protein n=1 Tax=Mycobacteroides abscessus TaxID=36809 RepID=UPI0009A7AE22|nr:hypothetical protein [Mycobacteroides abscessus]MDM2104328.1 hypothetical protein [Mycobacteroides abscessus]MDM2133331.1 hypothetical protein [Mycobacteroides abscessus]MDM2145022.1 hypothetical protein [Mycobacteroides abscessus]MDM2153207.1 hypothetical protein [Mycobacteroides abscessus]MDM2182240.1 hypothetical protein [Mycobacteroides abscessus]